MSRPISELTAATVDAVLLSDLVQSDERETLSRLVESSTYLQLLVAMWDLQIGKGAATQPVLCMGILVGWLCRGAAEEGAELERLLHGGDA